MKTGSTLSCTDENFSVIDVLKTRLFSECFVCIFSVFFSCDADCLKKKIEKEYGVSESMFYVLR